MKMRTLCFGCLVAGTLVAGSRSAEARAMGAYAGAAMDPLQATCFYESWGGAKMNASPGCAGEGWEVNLPIDTWNTTYDPVIWYYNNSGSDMRCATDAIYGNGGSAYEWSGWATAPGTGNGNFRPGTVYVPTGGFLFVDCQLKAWDEINQVSW